MIDLKILVVRDLLPLTKVDYAPNVVPLSLVIVGEKLDQATVVYINDIESPEFVVVSKNRIVAQIPTSQRDTQIRKVAVVATVPALNRKSLLHFEVTSSVGSIKGLERLVQNYVKLLLQTPGSDKFNPNEGGGVLRLIGRNVSKGDSKNLQAAIIGCIGRAKDQLVARQGRNSRIPSDERLLTASAEAVGYDPATTTLSARIAISAVSGKLAVANLTL